MFDYESSTKNYFKSIDNAHTYHDNFTNLKGVAGLRHRFVARSEQDALRSLLLRLDVKRVIDVPAGTGKMASLFKEFDYDVVAGDVSEEMLSIARDTYEKEGIPLSASHVIDLASATDSIEEKFDAVICVRLMHRVPDEIKIRMLSEIAKLAPCAIVHFSVDSLYQRFRRQLRKLVFNIDYDDKRLYIPLTRSHIRTLLQHDFEIRAEKSVGHGIVSGRMFLLRSK